MTRQALLALAALVAVGCTDGGTSSAPRTPTPSGDVACDRDAIQLAEPDIDVLVVGTAVPIEQPWFQDGDPTTGRGFESAVVYAVAAGLGFSADEVAWLIVDRGTMLGPDPKEFDFAVDQVTADEAGTEVELSTGYLELSTLLLVEPDHGGTTTSTPDLPQLRVAAVEDSAAARHLEAEVGEASELVPDESAGAVGLRSGDFDALAVELRQALRPALRGLAVLGRLPPHEDDPELRLVVQEENRILGCIDAALVALRESGRLDEIAREWLGETVTAQVLPSSDRG